VRDTLDTSAPPPRPPPGGRQYYLPEVYYFFDSKEVPLDVAMRVTSECVVQWCDRYNVPAVSYRASLQVAERKVPGREGDLPPTVPERVKFLHDLFDWVVETRGPLNLDVNLLAENRSVLFQDGALFVLSLTPAQFAELQDWWEAHCLPRDLYYSASDQRQLVEPVEYGGGVVRMAQRYTPHRWANRTAQDVEEMSVPSEAERERTFLDACSRLRQAIVLRRLELSEPGKQPDLGHLRELGLLSMVLYHYCRSRKAAPESELQQWREAIQRSFTEIYNLPR
jgi:hypothetical protein